MRNSRQSWWGQVRSSCPRPTTWPNSMRYLLPRIWAAARSRETPRRAPGPSRGSGASRVQGWAARAVANRPPPIRVSFSAGRYNRATRHETIRRGGGRSSTCCAVSATERDRTGSGRAAPADRRPQTTNADQSRGAEVEIQPTARTPAPARPGRSGVRSDPEQDPVTTRFVPGFPCLIEGPDDAGALGRRSRGSLRRAASWRQAASVRLLTSASGGQGCVTMASARAEGAVWLASFACTEWASSCWGNARCCGTGGQRCWTA